jgi:stage 0 sporulation regulatory protein
MEAMIMSQGGNLLEEITSKRNHLFEVAMHKGFLNEETLKCSQELDQLIYLYYQSIGM